MPCTSCVLTQPRVEVTSNIGLDVCYADHCSLHISTKHQMDSLGHLADLVWKAFCCGFTAFGIWYFVATSFATVRNYLCVWLLLLQFIYYGLMLISTLTLYPVPSRIARSLFPIIFSMSCVISYVTVTARDGPDEILRINNFLLHIAPTLANWIELLVRKFDTFEPKALKLWITICDVTIPVILMLSYYYWAFTDEVYQTSFNVDISSCVVVSVLSSSLCLLVSAYN